MLALVAEGTLDLKAEQSAVPEPEGVSEEPAHIHSAEETAEGAGAVHDNEATAEVSGRGNAEGSAPGVGSSVLEEGQLTSADLELLSGIEFSQGQQWALFLNKQ